VLERDFSVGEVIVGGVITKTEDWVPGKGEIKD